MKEKNIRGKNMDRKLLEERKKTVYEFICDEFYVPMKAKEIAIVLQVPKSQRGDLKEVLDALSIPRYELEGWEADDLLGTISRKCAAEGWECVVVTGDKDSLQLINETTKVKLVSTRMGQTTTRDMTEAAFREEYGFDPIHMIDLKALMGDSSDNIPGVKGVGRRPPWPWCRCTAQSITSMPTCRKS